MRIQALLIFLIGLTVGPAFAADKQIWACRTDHSGSEPILHLVEWDSRSYVKFAHVRFSAQHLLEQETHGWYFDNDGSGYYRYGLVLQPDGKAWFHDFQETDADGLSSPLDYFICRKIG